MIQKTGLTFISVMILLVWLTMNSCLNDNFNENNNMTLRTNRGCIKIDTSLFSLKLDSLHSNFQRCYLRFTSNAIKYTCLINIGTEKDFGFWAPNIWVTVQFDFIGQVINQFSFRRYLDKDVFRMGNKHVYSVHFTESEREELVISELMLNDSLKAQIRITRPLADIKVDNIMVESRNFIRHLEFSSYCD